MQKQEFAQCFGEPSSSPFMLGWRGLLHFACFWGPRAVMLCGIEADDAVMWWCSMHVSRWKKRKSSYDFDVSCGVMASSRRICAFAIWNGASSVNPMTPASSRGSTSSHHRKSPDAAAKHPWHIRASVSQSWFPATSDVAAQADEDEDAQHVMFCEPGSASMRLSPPCRVE